MKNAKIYNYAFTDEMVNALYYSSPLEGQGELNANSITAGQMKSRNWDQEFGGTKIDLDEGEVRMRAEGYYVINTSAGHFNFSPGGISSRDGVAYEGGDQAFSSEGGHSDRIGGYGGGNDQPSQ